MTISAPGAYSFSSVGTMDMIGLLYEGFFEPRDALLNLLKCDDDGGEPGQFLINANLSSARRYFLVVTTFSVMDTGSYALRALGPASVGLGPFLQPGK